MLAGKNPRDRAAELIAGTRLADPQFRRRLAHGGEQAIDDSNDPMIRLAREMEPEYRRIREIEDELEEIERQAYAHITQARFALEGTANYPDATFTLRLASAQFKAMRKTAVRFRPGPRSAARSSTRPRTTASPPGSCPRLAQGQTALDLATPFNFVCTADIIGGNSGSPVVNRAGELVGVIFDGNIQSLTAGFFYSDRQARAVSVDARAVRECLRRIYTADSLADELGR